MFIRGMRSMFHTTVAGGRLPQGRLSRTLIAAALSGALAFLLSAGSSTPMPLFGPQEWPLDARHFDAHRIWPLSTGAGVTVAVVDTGVDANNPALIGRVLPGVDLTDEAANGRVDTSSDSHGTSVAGVIAASGAGAAANRMAGLAPQSFILPIRVAVSTSAIDPARVAEGISYAATHGAQVINISLGTPIDNPEIRDTVAYAVSHNIIVVAAAGNSGEDGNPTQYPAALPGVIAVSGTARNGGLWSQGESGAYVTLVAPAENIFSTSDQGGYLTDGGTSYSAPYVAATAALLRARFPEETVGQIIARLVGTAHQLVGTVQRSNQDGYGAVDPFRALTAPAPITSTEPLLAAPTASRTDHSIRAVVLVAALLGVVALLALGLVWRRRVNRHRGEHPRKSPSPSSRSDQENTGPSATAVASRSRPGKSGDNRKLPDPPSKKSSGAIPTPSRGTKTPKSMKKR